MNRSERRRQDAQLGKGRITGPSGAESWLHQGRAHQQAGRFVEAEQAYLQALELAPRHAEAFHLLGLIAYRLNRLDDAISYLVRAIEYGPSAPVYRFNLGILLQKAGRLEEAVTTYKKAVELNGKYGDAYINLGNALRDSGQLQQAVRAYRQALAINPSHADTHNNLGVALKESGDLEEALTCYRRAIELKPVHLEAMNNLGLALMETGTLREAIASFQQALAIQPDYQKALYNLGVAWSWAGDENKAVNCLTRVARSRHDHGKPMTDSSVFRSRIKHDREQIDYLLHQHKLGDEQRPYLTALAECQRRLEQDSSPGNRVRMTAADLSGLAPSFNRMLFHHPPDRVSHGAINRTLDAHAVEERYHQAHPGVTFIDDLLNAEALEALRRFCWEATIWKKDYENGYCGAFLGDGFASPLLFQIAEELRLKFPGIFGAHRLTQAWAFKQDSARRGLNIHADAAAVNVNFWITPDEANLNKETGGLVVYDKEAPREWNFKDYNSEQSKPKIMGWLNGVGARAIRIPYRANRAVVFNSDLFHESDDISFRDEYLSRRINITLLYGYRLRDQPLPRT
ncbi:hypothetical protein W02_11480 [Nitrospira sp. KM1]|uniref:tetratricopeptide repeat protein n=1 Tax=Nitrospira sp. KM1 TaxID=1936990 RepID=UPI0013A77F85|nr:glycosyltransferase family 41 protein [Nitrospira sp. KM1]BCA54008.1 hypothetical protein W02_11480 [Nitrospira sp. KM1]